MCGIAGILEMDDRRPASAAVLERMLAAIRHRGPDEDGREIDRNLAMGMRRLSIIDLAGGSQPMYDESGRYAIVFNGEIYNYRELRAQLSARGHVLRTHSDTEVIVHLFEERGAACLEALRGMFAIAIWDSLTQRLFLARDRLGIKPLYYTRRGQTLVFASEIKALLQHPAVPRQLDQRALSDYLSLKYVPGPQTMFAGIHSLLPGHFLLADRDTVKIEQYWDVSFAKPSGSPRGEAEYIEELERLLKESIRLRLRSDVPFGAFLSGGVDSSLIVALMAEQLDAPVQTFSVGFAGSEGADELPYARQVARRFGCDHHSFQITAEDFVQHAEDVLWHLDQPIADQATVATHMVARLARQHVKMVLTGEGGDELFAGYARYQGDRYAALTRWLPPLVGRGMRGVCSHLPGLRRGKIAVNALSYRDQATRFANWFPMFTDDRKRSLLANWPAHLAAGARPVYDALLKGCDAAHPLDRMLYCDTKAWLVDYLLLRGDKLSMANSLEARVPLLDHRVVEFAAALPVDLKIRGRTRKYLLRRVAERWLPAEIIHRPKQGFPIPIDRWLRHEARELVEDNLSEQTIRRRDLFDCRVVRRLVQRHQSGYADHATELWGLISLEMWMRRFIDAPQTPSATATPCQTSSGC
ncbi:asparagine synthase (glutamine-hydrolyzing) [Roseimaritima sediminicola]|uniref:asparagine synthase (glutamine-hydrolyzing) n=1 Tax=Roseimaritima sediminicola TaxID=2662066 RepID=UPI0012983500|nr:asparagine synthase (glutamine-hydrolyzing) [Roseimaritima sediminicola]